MAFQSRLTGARRAAINSTSLSLITPGLVLNEKQSLSSVDGGQIIYAYMKVICLNCGVKNKVDANVCSFERSRYKWSSLNVSGLLSLLHNSVQDCNDQVNTLDVVIQNSQI